jgi:hypothetical protein
MQYPTILLVLLVSAAILVCGCTTSPGGVLSPTPSGGSGSLTPEPTVTLPSEKNVEIQINEKDPIYATITVIFAGGKGQVAVTDIEVRVTRADGPVVTKHLPAEKGSELKFEGTKDTDRIEAWVSLNDGTRYKIIDQLVPYRTRG